MLKPIFSTEITDPSHFHHLRTATKATPILTSAAPGPDGVAVNIQRGLFFIEYAGRQVLAQFSSIDTDKVVDLLVRYEIEEVLAEALALAPFAKAA